MVGARHAVPLLLLLCCHQLLHAAEPESSVITPDAATRDAFGQFANLLDTLQKHYVEPAKIQTGSQTREALRAFVRALDADADYLSPEEADAAKAPPDKDTGDIGLTVALRDNIMTVVTPLDGSTAQTAGLLGGEQIIALNSQPTLPMSPREFSTQLRGPIGTSVVLTLFDPETNTTRALAIERAAPAVVEPLKLKFLSNGIAYIRLSRFSVASVEQLLTQVKRAEEDRAKGMIIDLRNNPGGTLDAVLGAARLFVPAKAVMLSLEHAGEKRRVTFTSDDSRKFSAPVVVLVNGGTAAEAEVFAAALRDQQRARLVGSKTFGRGRHSASFPLPNGGVVVLPTALYLPPSKKPFHNTGLPPDIDVSLARDSERKLAAAGLGTFDWINDKSQMLATDLPLARALDLLAK